LTRAELQCPTCNVAVEIPAIELGPGITVGGFAIEKLISVGGMGKLFLARQLSMGRLVALKILPPQFCIDRDNVERFLNEVRVAAQLEHPNVVSSYEAGVDEGVHYLAMQYIEGRTLADRIEQEGALPEREVMRVGRKVASALAYGWGQHQILHRDVKPENILLDQAGEPRLADMGISKSMALSVGHTDVGTVMGTPNFMSPEQINDLSSADTRADMFSLGATLYHALTGKIPFDGKTVIQVLQHMAVESLPDPRVAQPTISRNGADLLRVMMARKPESRHQTWAALMEDMDRVLKKFPIKAAVPTGHASLIGGPGSKRATVTVRGHTAPGAPAAVGPDQAGKHEAAIPGLPTHPVPHKKMALPVVPLAIAAMVIVGLLMAGTLFRQYQRRQADEAVVRHAQERVEALEAQLAQAVAYARSNPTNYEAAKAKLIALEEQLAGTPLEGLAEDELGRIAEARSHAQDAAWRTLQGRADLLFADGKGEESLALLRHYDGEWADAMGSLRAEYLGVLSAGIRRQEEAEASRQAAELLALQSRFDELIADVAAGLLAGRCAEVSAQVLAADSGGVFSDTAALAHILAVSNVEDAILDTFKQSVGQRVSVGLKSGPENLRIRNVEESVVVADRQMNGGATVIIRFGVRDLSAKDRYVRVGMDGTKEGLIRQGLIAAWSGAYSSAATCFERVDSPLATSLYLAANAHKVAEPTPRRQAESGREEVLAKAEYNRMLESIQFVPTGGSSERDADAILRLGLSVLVKQRLRNQARAFKKSYGTTTFARTHAPVLAAMLTDEQTVPTDY